jgi:membrane protease YdiL (CAAX protease family)
MWLVMGIGLDAVADAVEAAPESSSWAMIGELWLQNLMLVLMALFGVGWLSRSSFRNVLRRLGLTQPTWRQVGIGIGLGLLAFLLLFPLSLLIEKVGFGIDPDVDRLTEELLGPLMTSLPGVITLGLAAALGEELVYRGALQPRFGIFFTALLFSLTHSQYGISVATLIVLALGLLLGWTRKRYNTTTAILLHATYNIAIGLSGFLLQ